MKPNGITHERVLVISGGKRRWRWRERDELRGQPFLKPRKR